MSLPRARDLPSALPRSGAPPSHEEAPWRRGARQPPPLPPRRRPCCPKPQASRAGKSTWRRRGSSHSPAGTMRHDHLIDVTTLGGNEWIGEPLFIFLDTYGNFLLVAKL